MKILLGLLALFILVAYSLYFVKIIKGSPQEFELDLSRVLEDWLEVGKPESLKILLGVSLLFEILYFGLVLALITNPVTLALTLAVVAIEIWHLFKILAAFKAFFAGLIASNAILDWRMERISAMGLFSHSLIVLLTLVFVA